MRIYVLLGGKGSLYLARDLSGSEFVFLAQFLHGLARYGRGAVWTRRRHRLLSSIFSLHGTVYQQRRFSVALVQWWYSQRSIVHRAETEERLER
jgi:hypothetical protein